MSGIIYIFDEKLSETVKNPDSGSFFVGKFFRCTEKEREPKRGRSKTRLRRKRDCDAAKGGKNALRFRPVCRSIGRKRAAPYPRHPSGSICPGRSAAKLPRCAICMKIPFLPYFKGRFYSNGMPFAKGIFHRINKIKKS